MARLFRTRLLLPSTALGLVTMLGGCVAYPAYPGYGYGYGYGYSPYYGDSYVAFGGGYGRGWHDGGGWHH